MSFAAGGDSPLSGPINCIATMSDVDWDDRIGLQDKWTNTEKGWKVAVEWRQTPFGVGLFAAEDLKRGTVIRVGKSGLNLLQFHDAADVMTFCKQDAHNVETPVDPKRVGYVSDYLYGFNPIAENGGEAPRWFGIWIPGNGLNHSVEANTEYRPAPGGTNEGINLVASCDVACGDQLFDDYRRHGHAPQWALDFAKQYGCTLNFAECNDFVNAPTA